MSPRNTVWSMPPCCFSRSFTRDVTIAEKAPALYFSQQLFAHQQVERRFDVAAVESCRTLRSHQRRSSSARRFVQSRSTPPVSRARTSCPAGHAVPRRGPCRISSSVRISAGADLPDPVDIRADVGIPRMRKIAPAGAAAAARDQDVRNGLTQILQRIDAPQLQGVPRDRDDRDWHVLKICSRRVAVTTISSSPGACPCCGCCPQITNETDAATAPTISLDFIAPPVRYLQRLT